MIPDNQLVRGIQFKSFWDLEAETPVGGVGGQAPYEPKSLGGPSPHNLIFFLNYEGGGEGEGLHVIN